jgi:hypothetical protein
MPILVLDSLPAHGADTLLRAICRSAPTKTLFTGADFLLTLSFRGGLGGLKRVIPVTMGPRPLSHLVLGLSLGDTVTGLATISSPVEVLKGDTQKADNAAVPDQLWLFAFAAGYADPSAGL